MTTKDLAVYDLKARVVRSATFGPHAELTAFPKDEDQFIFAGRELYVWNDRVYRVRAELVASPGRYYDADNALRTFRAWAGRLEQRFPRRSITQDDPPRTFACEQGSLVAKNQVDKLNRLDGWGELTFEQRAVLAMHCGAITAWTEEFQVAPSEVANVSVDPASGGGANASVIVLISHLPTETFVLQRVKAARDKAIGSM